MSKYINIMLVHFSNAYASGDFSGKIAYEIARILAGLIQVQQSSKAEACMKGSIRQLFRHCYGLGRIEYQGFKLIATPKLHCRGPKAEPLYLLRRDLGKLEREETRIKRLKQRNLRRRRQQQQIFENPQNMNQYIALLLRDYLQKLWIGDSPDVVLV